MTAISLVRRSRVAAAVAAAVISAPLAAAWTAELEVGSLRYPGIALDGPLITLSMANANTKLRRSIQYLSH